MRVGYVVLHVSHAEACRRFWVDQIGMVEPLQGFPRSTQARAASESPGVSVGR